MKKEEMLQMRIDGATYQEIADVYGISRQAVHYALKKYKERLVGEVRGRRFRCNDIKYTGIYEYFKANKKETVSSFAIKVFNIHTYNSGAISQKIRNFITGRNESHFTIEQIKRMCEIVGKPFEEVFKERTK